MGRAVTTHRQHAGLRHENGKPWRASTENGTDTTSCWRSVPVPQLSCVRTDGLMTMGMTAADGTYSVSVVAGICRFTSRRMRSSTGTATELPVCFHAWASDTGISKSSGKPWMRRHSLGDSFLMTPSTMYSPVFPPMPPPYALSLCYSAANCRSCISR